MQDPNLPVPPAPVLPVSTKLGGERAFDYGHTKVNDIEVLTRDDPKKKQKQVTGLVINGEQLAPTPRFWHSLQTLFGFSSNIFYYFSHQEVFARVSERCPNDRLRFCVERNPNQPPRLLAATRPEKAVVTHDVLMETIYKYNAKDVEYYDGLNTSVHTPRIGGDKWTVGSDAFTNQFCLEVPVDGYGKPVVYLSCMSVLGKNMLIARSHIFKTELNTGKGDDVVRSAVLRALDSFNNEDGYKALRDRFLVSANSRASVYESTTFYKLLVRLHAQENILGVGRVGRSASSVSEVEEKGSPLIARFHEVTGDISTIYGLANLDALAVKRQRVLPVKCTVYDLINFATEVATHYCTTAGRIVLYGWLGNLVGQEGYDLEGVNANWEDFENMLPGER